MRHKDTAKFEFTQLYVYLHLHYVKTTFTKPLREGVKEFKSQCKAAVNLRRSKGTIMGAIFPLR